MLFTDPSGPTGPVVFDMMLHIHLAEYHNVASQYSTTVRSAPTLVILAPKLVFEKYRPSITRLRSTFLLFRIPFLGHEIQNFEFFGDKSVCTLFWNKACSFKMKKPPYCITTLLTTFVRYYYFCLSILLAICHDIWSIFLCRLLSYYGMNTGGMKMFGFWKIGSIRVIFRALF